MRHGFVAYAKAKPHILEMSNEEIIEEIKLFIRDLKCDSQVVSDHIINLLPEVEGKLPEDKAKMLDVVRRFQALPSESRDIYKLGRRLGMYNTLGELDDPARRRNVEQVMEQIGAGELDDVLFKLMERYI